MLSQLVKAQQLQILSGTMTPNEAREIENREPYDGGNEFVAPSITPNIGSDAIPPEK